MSSIWTPGEGLPTPSGGGGGGGGRKRVTVAGYIEHAVYHPSQGSISVLLRMKDGTSRVAALSKDSVTFRGKKHHELSDKEVDREMERTAELFRKAQGRKIRLEVDEEQAESR